MFGKRQKLQIRNPQIQSEFKVYNEDYLVIRLAPFFYLSQFDHRKSKPQLLPQGGYYAH